MLQMRRIGIRSCSYKQKSEKYKKGDGGIFKLCYQEVQYLLPEKRIKSRHGKRLCLIWLKHFPRIVLKYRRKPLSVFFLLLLSFTLPFDPVGLIHHSAFVLPEKLYHKYWQKYIVKLIKLTL